MGAAGSRCLSPGTGPGDDAGSIVLRGGRAVAVIDPARGGLLRSVTIDGDELLVPPFDYAGPIPRHGSFVLAPWVGEMARGRLPFRGSEHFLPANIGPHAVHGLVFDAPWTVVECSIDALTLRRDLLAPWPFGGWVTQRFELDGGGLTQTVAVHAASEAMPVAFGWHPWFRIPSRGRSRVVVDAARYLELQPDLLPTGEIRPLTADLDLRNGRDLDGRELDMVLLGANSPARLELPSRTLEISFDAAIDIVTVFTQPGFVCIEPWTSWPDAAHWAARGAATGLIELDAKETVGRWMRWSW